MVNAIILLCISVVTLFIGYQSLRYKRTYWFAPTISGFKNRKKKDNSCLALLTGIMMIFLGLFVLFIFVKSLF